MFYGSAKNIESKFEIPESDDDLIRQQKIVNCYMEKADKLARFTMVCGFIVGVIIVYYADSGF